MSKLPPDAAPPGPVPAARDLIPLLRFSTNDLAPADRYPTWHERDWPSMKPVYRCDPTEPFDTRWVSAPLGDVTFVHTAITGVRWERRMDDIRSSDFDPIIIGMMKEGEAQGDFDGRAFHQTAGTFHFHDLARPSLHVSTASLTYSLVAPRAVAQAWFGPLDDIHGLVVPPADAALMFALAEQVERMLPRLDVAQAERLGRVFMETAAVALATARPPREDAVHPSAVLRRRAQAWIEPRIGLREPVVDEICTALETTRGRLYAAFAADGGVAAYVLTQRLERARVALADLTRAEPIGTIAHRLGFSDAAHLSRAYRQRYGMTPTQYRHLRRADQFQPI